MYGLNFLTASPVGRDILIHCCISRCGMDGKVILGEIEMIRMGPVLMEMGFVDWQ